MRIRKILTLFAICLLVVVNVLPLTAQASKTNSKVVRVGWYDSTYNTIDESGFRTGYAYEYQLKLSAYNGWKYEYISGSWPDLLQMLKEGKIDLMSDVSHTIEREKYMSFSSLPMGTEEYYLFTAPGNEDISDTEKSTLNGKKVGVNRDSIQADFYMDWAEKNNIKSDIVLVACTEDESLQMLENGELDAYVTVDSFMDASRAKPVYKIGFSDYYFAVAKNRTDLLEELDYAMNRIQDENRYYNVEMYEKYIRKTGANASFSTDESQWLSQHGTIRVGYQDNYLAFCATDEETGELTGVMKDYLEIASDCVPNSHIDFKAVGYSTVNDAINALKKGEIDCVFPANLSGYEAEKQGTVITPSLINTEMYAIVRAQGPNIFSKDSKITAAVNKGNLNYEAFLAKHYPTWEKAYYNNTAECLEAVSQGKADCLILSNYRFNNISRLCKKYHLTNYSTGIEMDYCFAVKEGETALYSILSKIISMVPDTAVNTALSQYITEESKLTFNDFISDNLNIFMGIISVIVLIILLLLMMNMRAASKSRKLIHATEIDDLTGLYTRKYFFQYANRIHRDHPNRPLDAIVINIEQFHSVNALYGRELGDSVLRALGNEISDIAKEANGIAGRFEADRFDIYCCHEQPYQTIFDRLQTKLDELVPNANIRIRMGVMPWRAKMEPEMLFDRARTACNMARGHYNTPLIIYDDFVSERESYEQRLVNDLRNALDTEEFEVYYQPKVYVKTDDPKTVSAEALVRWNHHELGMISPGDFVPLFERNGQISLLDKYVLSKVANQIAEWRKKYGMSIPVSINLSRVDVFDPLLEDTLESVLDKNNLEHEAITLEITESAYTENADQVIQVIAKLRNKGFKIEMDDFGTGYSSLNMLSSLPFDSLKMDKEFIRNIEHEERDQQLVALIINIANNLKVPVIAEGVETEAQLQLIKKLGCTLVQGYYFSRPLPAEEFERKYLNNGKVGSTDE